MTVQEAVQQLQHASVADRIQAIELLLQSLKSEIVYSRPIETKPFRVRAFNLGVDVQVDRDEMYTDRVL